MSEQPTTPAPTEPAPAPEAAQGEPADKPLGPNGEKALAAERDARKSAEQTARDLQAKLNEIETAKLSDLERAQKAAQEAQEAAAKAASDALRWRTAARFGISDDDAELFLTATDEATLARQAQRLAERAGTPTTPRPDPSQGGTGEPVALNGDPLLADLKAKLGIA